MPQKRTKKNSNRKHPSQAKYSLFQHFTTKIAKIVLHQKMLTQSYVQCYYFVFVFINLYAYITVLKCIVTAINIFFLLLFSLSNFNVFHWFAFRPSQQFHDILAWLVDVRCYEFIKNYKWISDMQSASLCFFCEKGCHLLWRMIYGSVSLTSPVGRTTPGSETASSFLLDGTQYSPVLSSEYSTEEGGGSHAFLPTFQSFHSHTVYALIKKIGITVAV